MKLIDKSAVVAEIERQLHYVNSKIESYEHVDSVRSNAYFRMLGNRSVLESIKDFLNTLETKEVDLEKEIDKWICDDAITHEDCSITDVISTAKHFFELGLKAKEDKE